MYRKGVEEEAVRGRWKEYFKKLLNIKSEGEAILTCKVMIRGDKKLHEHKLNKRE